MFDILINEIDGEPRMRDLDVAEALEFERPRKIRELIARRKVDLEELGEVRPTVGRTSPQGGSPGEEYWLNEKQALFICTKSEAKNALDITIQMIEVFSAWRHGQLVPRGLAGAGGRGGEIGEKDALIALVEDVNFPNLMVLVREARVTHGKKAAQRLWKRAGLPMPEAADIEAEAAQVGEVSQFLQEYCICTGNNKFTPVAELLAGYKHWCRTARRLPLSDGTFAKRLAGLAGSYEDPATGFGFAKHKASVSGYMGLCVDGFAVAV